MLKTITLGKDKRVKIKKLAFSFKNVANQAKYRYAKWSNKVILNQIEGCRLKVSISAIRFILLTPTISAFNWRTAERIDFSALVAQA